MLENLAVTAEKCMDAICEQVGTVELEAFIYYVRSQSFDYTKWQQEHFDSKTPEEIYALLQNHGEKHPFKGKKATVI